MGDDGAGELPGVVWFVVIVVVALDAVDVPDDRGDTLGGGLLLRVAEVRVPDVLVDPRLVDLKAQNAFRRKLRIVFERVDLEEYFPYDYLDHLGKRAVWLTDSLDTGEIVDPAGVRRESVSGVGKGQTDLFSF